MKKLNLLKNMLTSLFLIVGFVFSAHAQEKVIYETGFERIEGYTIGTSYNNTTVNYSGASGNQWGIYYGTASTTLSITDSASLQMRWYDKEADKANFGYAFTNFALKNVTKVNFNAKNTSGINVSVSYSIDGGISYTGDSLFTLKASTTNHTYIISTTGEYENVKLKFTLVTPSGASGTLRLYIDDVIVYGMSNVAPTTTEAPVFSANTGTYYESFNVTLSSTTEGASIYYTTNGDEPTAESALYTTPIPVNETTTLKAIAIKDGLSNSSVATATYTMDFTPSISIDQPYFHFGRKNIDETYTENFAITTRNLTSDLTVSITGEGFSVNPKMISQTATSTTLTVTFAPIAVEDYKGTITIAGNDIETKEIQLAGKGKVSGINLPFQSDFSTVEGASTASSSMVSLADTVMPTGFLFDADGKIYGAGEKLKLGTSSAIGFLSTEPIHVGDISTIEVKFNALAWAQTTTAKTATITLSYGEQSKEITVAGKVGWPVEASHLIEYSHQFTSISEPTSIVVKTSLSSTTNDPRIFIDNVRIAEPSPVVQVATPSITPNSGNYVEEQEITITTATEGAIIYYTTDGTNPDAIFNTYTEPFDLSTDATVKAFAVKEGMDTSDIATATYTFTLPVTVESIEALKALAPEYTGTANVGIVEYSFTGNAIVTFTAANRNQKMIEDATGAILIDDKNGIITTAISVGDKITNITGTLTNYSGLLQMVPTSAEVTVISSGNAIPEPVIVTIEQLTGNYAAYESRLLKIENVVFTGSQKFTTSGAQNVNFRQGEETMVCRNNFRTLDMSVAVNDTGSIVGFPIRYVDAYQIAPRTNADIDLYEEPGVVATPTFNPVAGTYYTTQSVTISTTTEGATIYYTIDGNTPTTSSTEYTKAIPVATTTIIKAIAVKTDYTDSEVATAEYVIAAEPEKPKAQVLLRPTHIDLSDETSESAVLMEISGYSDTLKPRYRLYNALNQHNCWDVQTGAYITNTSYAGGPLVVGDISGGTTFWIMFQRSSNNTTTANYRDRIGKYSKDENFQTVALPAATSITSSFTLSGRYTGTTEYDNTQKYVVLAFSGTDLVSAASTVLNDGVFSVVCPEGTTIDKIELRTASNITVITENGTWTETKNLGSIPENTDQVAAPIFTPAAGTYYDAQQVTIETATDGAAIYYTNDGSTPTKESARYTSAIAVNTTTTLKAIAIKEGMENSNVVSATYAFPIEVANIAAFKAANTETNNAVYKITGDVTFVYRSARYMYVEDNTGGLLIYDNYEPIITEKYEEGDVINGEIYGTYALYNGLVEMVPTRNTIASTTKKTVIPTRATISEILKNYDQYESRLVQIVDVVFEEGKFTTTASNIKFSQEGDTLACRNQFEKFEMDIEAGYNADVTGFVSIRDAAIQIYLRNKNDIVDHAAVVATPTFEPEEGEYTELAIIISCETEDAVIYYTLDGTTPDSTNGTLYEDPILMITLSNNGSQSITVKAIAYKENMNASNVATANYTLKGVGIDDNELANISVFPNPATDAIYVNITEVKVNKMEVISFAGQVLYSVTNPNSEVAQISIADYSKGIYFIRLYTANGVAVKKFIKM